MLFYLNFLGILLAVFRIFAERNITTLLSVSTFSLFWTINFCIFSREWYSRLGGCTALRFIIENYPSFFVRKHASQFLTAFIEVSGFLLSGVYLLLIINTI